MRTLTVVNQKGGCGKTTTAVNLAAVMASRGARVILIDLDPQSHCAAALGIPESGIESSAVDALLDPAGVPLDGLIWQPAPNLHVLPSTMGLSRLESAAGGLMSAWDRDRRLDQFLGRIAHRFDWAIIDCPPAIGLLTFNAIRACDEAIIPVETGFLALRGARRQVSTFSAAIERMGRAVVLRLLPTMHRTDSKIGRDVLEAMGREFGELVVPLAIHSHEALREAVALGQPITEYAPASDAHDDFCRLHQWLCANPVEEHERNVAPLVETIATSEAEAPTAAPMNGAAGAGRVEELARRLRAQADGISPPRGATSS